MDPSFGYTYIFLDQGVLQRGFPQVWEGDIGLQGGKKVVPQVIAVTLLLPKAPAQNKCILSKYPNRLDKNIQSNSTGKKNIRSVKNYGIIISNSNIVLFMYFLNT